MALQVFQELVLLLVLLAVLVEGHFLGMAETKYHKLELDQYRGLVDMHMAQVEVGPWALLLRQPGRAEMDHLV